MENTEVQSNGTIAICTPMYGGVAHQVYINSIIRIMDELRMRGYASVLNTVANESLITRARNLLVHNSLKLDNLQGILFLDADQGVDAEDVISLIESGKDIIGVPTPKKSINWKQVQKAALLNRDELNLYSGNFVVEFINNEKVEVSYVDPVEVKYAGSGLMYISAKVFDDLKPICKTYSNNFTNGANLSEDIVEYFSTSIVEDTNELLSEDYNFCRLWRSLGNSVWIAPWVTTVHAGSYVFDGSFAHTVDLLSSLEKLNK